MSAVAALLELEDTLQFVASKEVVESCRKGFAKAQNEIETLQAERSHLLASLEKIAADWSIKSDKCDPGDPDRFRGTQEEFDVACEKSEILARCSEEIMTAIAKVTGGAS